MSDSLLNFYIPGPLELVRQQKGNVELKKLFLYTAGVNPLRALEFLNIENISFTTFFILKNEIGSSMVRHLISIHHQLALKLLEGLAREDRSAIRSMISKIDSETSCRTFKWILETGFRDDGVSKDFDEALDTASLVLLKESDYSSFLPVVTELIFLRNRRGGFIYDLVWACYETADPRCLYFLAKGLYSNNWDDIELSRKLLHFIPCIKNRLSIDPALQYSQALEWLDTNYTQLKFTGESFQQTFNPVPYTVAAEV